MTERKEGLGNRLSRWFREMKSELKKVVWPTWEQVVKNTSVVIVMVVVIGAFIWLVDWLMTLGVGSLLSLVP